VLRIAPATSDRHSGATPPPRGAELVDVASGLVVRPGKFTAIVDPDPDAAAAVATRLGRFDDAVHREAPVLWGGIDHTTVPVAAVRKRIVVSGANPYLFAGPLLDELDVQSSRDTAPVATTTGRIRRVNRALQAASAAETVDALPGGLAAPMTERGRSFSGGQRQRLSLARALLTDAEVLILIEPTSAVDSYTESEIAGQLRTVRGDRTTVLVTSSPLLLGTADTIAVMRHGHVLGTGTHAELLRQADEIGDLYRSVVARSSSSAEPAADENLDAAWTGSIDTLWSDAVATGAIALPKPQDDDEADEPGGDDAASDR
jgi:ABC-type multidrug transport system fused ATPase/permease subunit